MSLDETKNIKSTFIIEVAGKPPEHLTDSLKKLIDKLKQEKGISVKNQKINKPVLMKDQKDFYTNFAEIELEVGDVLTLLSLIFRYMPAHVEINYPENIRMTNDGLTIILNELTRRLHGYDEIARVIQIEKKILENKLRAILEEKNKDKKEKKK